MSTNTPEHMIVEAFSFGPSGKHSVISAAGMDTSHSMMAAAGIGGCSMKRLKCC
ncbi:hypothetical protein [uncultured Sphaerochaeta sp.]|uniref:hypothetical protein n=1 Tax=uncultured Sphaerochaeta sp. TaxID=886478 RepID=UPI003749A216